MSNEKSLWWLVFMDDLDGPSDSAKFRGVAILRAAGPDEALQKSIDDGCNPGSGLRVIFCLLENEQHSIRPDEIGRLLQATEVDAIKARIEAAAAKAATGLWWLSFCDGDKPRGESFLGVSIVRACDPRDAVMTAWQNDCNPGGQVMISGPMIGADAHIRPEEIGRLMGKDEVDALNARLAAASRASLH